MTEDEMVGRHYQLDGHQLGHQLEQALGIGDGQGSLDNMLKSSDITLLTKVCIAKAMVFPLVIHGCESWTIKKTENGCF